MATRVETLSLGQSAARGEVKYADPETFAHALDQLIKQDKEGAFYTEGVVSRAQYYTDASNFPNQFYYSKTDHDVNFARFVQMKRESSKSKPLRVDFLNALEKTVVQLVSKFKGYEITNVETHCTLKKGSANGVLAFHADYSDSDNKRRLVIVASLYGPSTVYELGGGEGDIRLPDGVVVGHTGLVRHKSPSDKMPEGRFALVIELRKKHRGRSFLTGW